MHTLTQMVQTRPLLNFHSHAHPMSPQTPRTHRKVKLQSCCACRLWHFHRNRQGRLSEPKWRALIWNYSLCVIERLKNECATSSQLHRLSVWVRICSTLQRRTKALIGGSADDKVVAREPCRSTDSLRQSHTEKLLLQMAAHAPAVLGLICLSKPRIFWPFSPGSQGWI